MTHPATTGSSESFSRSQWWASWSPGLSFTCRYRDSAPFDRSLAGVSGFEQDPASSSTASLGGMKQTLKLRLIVTEPFPAVRCAMQRGKSDLLPPTTSEGDLRFDFTVQADLEKEPPGLSGEFTQGPPAKRFVYINSGSYAGQPGTQWSRRAKVPITGIASSMARDAIASGGILQATVWGRAKDGGPFCASVPLLSEWLPVGADD